MVQGRYTALIVSVLLHLILAVILIYTSSNQITPSTPQKITKIESYIYQPPKTVLPTVSETQQTDQKSENTVDVDAKEIAKPDLAVETQRAQTPIPVPNNQKNKNKILTSEQSPKIVGIKQRVLEQLYNLNSQITEESINTEVYEHFRHRSPSVMHGEPASVPKSTIPLTIEQQRNRRTQRLDDSLAIIKGDNGTCMIEEDLSKVGMEGVKAYSGFACGESKFDKSFRLHMKKVHKKLGKK